MKRSVYWTTLLLFTISFFSTVVACNQSQSGTHSTLGSKTLAQSTPILTESTPTLTFAWETDSLLTTVESVLYDPVTQLIYTANIEGDFMEKDGQGSISTVDLQGNVVARDWVSGLDAPTGLSIYEGRLYTTDIDRIIEIDIASGTITNSYAIEGASALNDVTVSPDGVVYTSDTGGNAVYQLKDGVATKWMADIDTPNGLVFHENTLLVSQWTPETLGAINIATKDLINIANGLPQADGVEMLEDNQYLVSSWGGRVYYIDASGNASIILDTSAEGKNAADVSLIADHSMILVATFSKNTISAYRFEDR